MNEDEFGFPALPKRNITIEPIKSGIGVMMAGGNPASGARQENDFYSTPIDVTKILAKRYPMHDKHVWEPCSGSDAMVMVLENFGAQVFASDINPQGRGEKLNFLETKEFYNIHEYAIITNPPFNIAEQMIRHAWLNLKPYWMALVLKSTYWHSIKRQKLWNECRPSAIHPLTWRPDFMRLGRPTMEMMWCVWDRSNGDAPTIYEPLNR